MAYVANIVTEAEMNFMAGELVDATGNIEANHILLQDYAEAYLSAFCEYDISTNFATINAVTKILISEWAARFAGCDLIRYNMNGYATTSESTARIAAEDMINYHVFRMKEIENLLKLQGVQNFMGI